MDINAAKRMAKLQARIDYLEENRRYIQNALEMVLSLSDFHKHLGKESNHHQLLQEALERFEKIIPLQGCAIYLVDDATSEFTLTLCEPQSWHDLISAQVEFMIDEGLFAWAIRERRAIFTSSDDHENQFMVHVIANHSRIQGMFVGLLPAAKISIPDSSLSLLSITLLNLANVMESMRLYQWIKNQNVYLEKKVTERTLKLDRSRQKLKQALISLEKMADEANQANKAKSQFLANISHEIRTPLNGIIGCAELMLKSEDIDHCRTLAGISLGESEHLLNLINNVLDYSKIEAGKIELEHKPFNLDGLLQAVVAGLEIQAQAKGLKLYLRIPGNLHHAVIGDALRLRQVLINLVNNAIKFTHQGSVTLAVGKTANAGKDRQTLTFSVIDTGIGIPADRHEAIFKRFTQVDQSTTRRYGGTGLGTTIAYQLVALMGGQLKVASRTGHGTTFSFTIDLFMTDSETAIDSGDPGEALGEFNRPVKSHCPAHILLAEDTPVNQMVMRSHLEAHGHTVVIADNGLVAVEACRIQKFDLILMDIQMPEMDGIEAARHIRAQMPAGDLMPIVALTANTDAHTRSTCEAAGMKTVLTKPIRRDALLKAVHEILSRGPSANPAVGGRTMTQDHGSPPISANPHRQPLDLATAVYEFGDPDIVRQVIEKLLAGRSEQIDNIRRALEQNEIDTIKQISHAVKGGAASAEASILADVAAQLEEQCAAGAISHLHLAVDRLEAAWRDLELYVDRINWQQEGI